MRTVAVCLSILLVPGVVQAQDWRPFEIDLPESRVNETLRVQQDAARRAAQNEPEREPESLGEAWSQLMDTLVDIVGARVGFEPGLLRFDVRARVFLFVGYSYVDTSFALRPSVRAPNVIVLEGVSGRDRWGANSQWEAMSTSSIASYLRKLPEQVGGSLGPNATVTYERAADGHGPRVVFDMSRLPEVRDTELLGVVMRQDEVTLRGRTHRSAFELDLTAGALKEGMRGGSSVPELDALLGAGGRTDVGRTNPGRITFDGKYKVGWLPETAYSAIVKVERAGPHSIRFVLEDVRIGGARTDKFLRGRAGRRVRSWIMRQVYTRFDAVEKAVNTAYRRGKIDVRMTRETATSRVLHFRRGRAGDISVRPGFRIDAVEVLPGRIRITAGLERGVIYREEDLVEVELVEVAPSRARRGITGALGE